MPHNDYDDYERYSMSAAVLNQYNEVKLAKQGLEYVMNFVMNFLCIHGLFLVCSHARN